MILGANQAYAGPMPGIHWVPVIITSVLQPVAISASLELKVTHIELNLTWDEAQAKQADTCRVSGGPPNHTYPLLLFLCDNNGITGQLLVMDSDSLNFYT